MMKYKDYAFNRANKESFMKWVFSFNRYRNRTNLNWYVKFLDNDVRRLRDWKVSFSFDLLSIIVIIR